MKNFTYRVKEETKMAKKLIATILALVMIVGLLPMIPASTTALAASSGSCGANITWQLDDSGTLTITGYGAMTDYEQGISFYPPWYEQRTNIKKVVFKNTESGITSIGDSAFEGCSNLTDVIVPPTLKIVGDYAFGFCKNLKDFSLPESVTRIGETAFYDCSSLTRVPSDSELKNVVSIGREAFAHCKGIITAVIPPMLTEIPSELYYSCDNLKRLIVPENVTVIGYNAFCSCGYLEEVVLNAGVTELRNGAFAGCGDLKKIFVSNPLQLESYAFSRCYNMNEINIAISESEFNSKSYFEYGNDEFDPTSCTYQEKFAIVLHPYGGYGGAFGTLGAPRYLTKTANTDFAFNNENLYDLSKAGATFLGWNTKPDGSGTTYKPGDTYTDNATLNLYAQWSTIQPEESIKRLSGSSRNGTAVAISDEVVKAMFGCKAVVLANGWNFADALAGGPLAYALKASILLITNDESDEATYAEIKRLGVKDVYILGGNVAVSKDVETKLKGDGYTVNRIAGDTRFETAVMIAEKMDTLRDGYSKNAFFAYSHNYPDALAVSGVAAVDNAPILYVDESGMLDSATKAYVERCEFDEGYIVGGIGAISGLAEGNIKNSGAKKVFRIAGATRYETCLAINKAFPDRLNGSTICVSTGINFPDALSGSVLAAKNRAPMLLVAPDESLSKAQKEYIEEFYSGGYGRAFIFGGKVAVPEAIENELKKLVP